MLLLTPEEMGRADALAAESGIDSFGLMVKAGHAVSATVLKHYPAADRVVVLCGPGKNGGDGYVAASALLAAGCKVCVYHLGTTRRLTGDTAKAFKTCTATMAPLADYVAKPGDVIVDALFGAGLARPLASDLTNLIETIHQKNLPIIAVDLPSGLSGGQGDVLGSAFQAVHTVTFMRPKPGHFLFPGRSLCGALEVIDIGIPERILACVGGKIYLNEPALWRNSLPEPDARSHKFTRGHLTVFSGRSGATGASRLCAMAGLKAGSGLVTLAVPADAKAEAAAHLTAVMLREISDESALSLWLEDKRLSAFVLGPGFGTGEKARDFGCMLAGRPLVLDADGISAFAEQPDLIFNALAGHPVHTVMTPHEGEFSRLFPDISASGSIGKLEKARAAAVQSNAVILYKGADTVIASPDGRAAINANAPPWLATAGSGDVLAGIIGGLLAQSVPAFEAACAGAWLHGAAGNSAGEGLTAEDLPRHLPHYSQIIHGASAQPQ